MRPDLPQPFSSHTRSSSCRSPAETARSVPLRYPSVFQQCLRQWRQGNPARGKTLPRLISTDDDLEYQPSSSSFNARSPNTHSASSISDHNVRVQSPCNCKAMRAGSCQAPDGSSPDNRAPVAAPPIIIDHRSDRALISLNNWKCGIISPLPCGRQSKRTCCPCPVRSRPTGGLYGVTPPGDQDQDRCLYSHAGVSA
jgi:hypothetical protein